ncbi:tRNA pseudouridine(38-40) synthase TruA [Buchnera aphidicola (Kurisakia onigurumii)]|uniref:tRNA pseudouridine(38-40) synthase TruA n=1 Tax=Buchnera aphidicola TaxID=9 RepID=UPI0031B694AF
MKFALGIEYNGSYYHGWQIQNNIPTVQEKLEFALSKIASHQINVICAGRTDSGVHSIGQVVHFNTTAKRKLTAWTLGVNSYLPKDISVIWAKQVPDYFHARFSALSRSYRYVIYNNHIRPAIGFSEVCHFYKKNIDVKKMHKSAILLLGEHDFSSFRAKNCQSNTPIRNIFYINVFRIHDWVILDIEANSFLYHMVRNITGSLVEIGINNQQENWISFLLKKKNRSFAGPTLQSSGLFLTAVRYPKELGLNLNKKFIFSRKHI